MVDVESFIIPYPQQSVYDNLLARNFECSSNLLVADEQLAPSDVLRVKSPLLRAFPWHTGVVLELPNFLGNVGDDNLMGVRQNLICNRLSNSFKTRAFFPLSTNVRRLSSSQQVLVAIPKTMMFNPCWELKSQSTIRGKQCLHYRMFWWNLWGLRVRVSCFRCLRGTASLMWLRLWKGCVLTQHRYRGHQRQKAPSQYDF